MKMKFADSELEFELLDGEYRRYIEEDGNNGAEYLCVGVMGNNRILFQYIDETKESVDFVQSIMSNMPEFALYYLINVLHVNENVLVRLTQYLGTPTGFEIYYDCDCTDNNINNLIDWMREHNDFAAEEFRYTEVVGGHQQCAGE